MSPIEHAPTETNGSIAAPDTNGRYVVYTSTQALFFSLDTCAKILDVPSNTFHFIGGTVGGGFGGKVDTLTEPLAILGAMLTGRPVRYQLGREEEMQFGSPRGAERIYIKDGVMRDGRIVARKIRAYFDSGAYTRLSSYAVVKCAAHLPGPYTIPNVSWRHLLRVHQPDAGHRHARLRRHGDGLCARMPDGQARASRRHRPDGVPDSQRLSRRRHEGAPARGEKHRADRMRPGRRRKGQVAAARRGQADVVAHGWRRQPRRHLADAARAGSATRRRFAAANHLRSRARLQRSSHRRPRRRLLPRGHQLRRRRMAPPASLPSSAPGGADHGKASRTRHRLDQLSHRHEPRRRPQPGAGSFQPQRQVHGVAVVDRSRPGHEIGDAADLRGDARRARRRRLCRHRGLRHRPALHGLVRLARHASRRQRCHGGGQGSARRHDGSRRRGAGSQRRRSRHRRARQHPRQGRAAPFDLHQGRRHRRAVQARQDDIGTRHLSGAAVRGQSRDRRDVPRHLLRARLSGRRGRGRRRDRRGRDGAHGQRV